MCCTKKALIDTECSVNRIIHDYFLDFDRIIKKYTNCNENLYFNKQNKQNEKEVTDYKKFYYRKLRTIFFYEACPLK